MRDLDRLPKAHLHVHLESTVRADTLAELAAAHGRPAPARPTAYADFTAFAAHNGLVRDCLRTPDDFHRIAVEYCADEAAQGVGYAEVTFTAAAHGERLGGAESLLEAVLAGLAEGGARYGVDCRLILDHPRRRSVERATETLRLAIRYAPAVVGIGLAGAEGYPVTPFAGVCAAARDAGLALVHHAGETAGPDSVAEAVTVGLADRIGHGLSALDDPSSVALLRERRVPLEVCPSSNVALGIVPSWELHPLPRMRDAGLVVTLNADVPACVGSTLTDEYARARAVFGYGDDVLAALAHASVDASFAAPEVAGRLHDGITDWLCEETP